MLQLLLRHISSCAQSVILASFRFCQIALLVTSFLHAPSFLDLLTLRFIDFPSSLDLQISKLSDSSAALSSFDLQISKLSNFSISRRLTDARVFQDVISRRIETTVWADSFLTNYSNKVSK